MLNVVFSGIVGNFATTGWIVCNFVLCLSQVQRFQQGAFSFKFTKGMCILRTRVHGPFWNVLSCANLTKRDVQKPVYFFIPKYRDLLDALVALAKINLGNIINTIGQLIEPLTV